MNVRLGGLVDRYAAAVTRRRYAAGTVVSGYAVKGAATDTTVQAMVLPASGRDIARVREGLRDRVRFMAWTTADLRTVDEAGGLDPDELVYGGVRYQVAAVRDFVAHGEFKELALLAVDP